jgi:hypothetical protein
MERFNSFKSKANEFANSQKGKLDGAKGKFDGAKGKGMSLPGYTNASSVFREEGGGDCWITAFRND